MIAQPLAALLLAAAILAVPGPADVRARLARVAVAGTEARAHGSAGGHDHGGLVRARSTSVLPALAALFVAAVPVAVAGWPFGVAAAPVLGLGMFYGGRRALRGQGDRGRRTAGDPLRLAACWDLLAACLRAGLPVPVAVRAVAGELPAAGADALRRTGELLTLGADPVAAWAPALEDPDIAPLARAARRTARSGTALAGAAAELAAEVRSSTHDHEEARAQRTAVLITGPLGLCFLPAFLCLGVLPVVMALADRLMSAW